MSDLSREVVPDKWSLNRERPVTKALKFPARTKKELYHLNWNWSVQEGVYTERHDDRYSGRVP